MGEFHIYTTEAQPLTKYVDSNLGPGNEFTFETPATKRVACRCCGRRRQAKHLSIQVYYDCAHIFCTVPCQRRHWLLRARRWCKPGCPFCTQVSGGQR